MSLIARPGLMYLSGELTMTFYWYPHNHRPCAVLILVKTATEILNFAPKHGLAVCNVARFN